MSDFVLAFLLTLNQLFAAPAPSDEAWTVEQEWQSKDGVYQFAALHASLAEQCARDGSAIQLPLLVHGVHQLYVDGELFAQFGDPTFHSTYVVYNNPAVSCHTLQRGSREILWVATSYSQYFARHLSYPYITQDVWIGAQSEVAWMAVVSSALMTLALFSCIVFWQSLRTYAVLCSIGCLGWSLFFVSMAGGGSLFQLSMLEAHKFGDVGLWLGVSFLFACYFLDRRISAKMYGALLVCACFAFGFIVFGRTGDDVQFGTSIPFPIAIIASIFVLRSVFRSQRLLAWQKTLNLLSVGLFAVCVIHDVGLTLGMYEGMLSAPFGALAAFLGIAVNAGYHLNALHATTLKMREKLEARVVSQDAELNQREAKNRGLEQRRVQWLEFVNKFTRHEIRNAVSGVIQSIELAKTNPGKGEYLERASTSASRIRTVMEAISNASSMESVVHEAKLEAIDIGEIVSSHVEELSVVHQDRSIMTRIATGRSIIGSVGLIEMLLDKLVNNAVEHALEQSEITVEVFEEEDYVVLAVSNVGEALPTDCSGLFDLSVSSKPKSEGHFGIGLYISKQIAEVHLASIEAEELLPGPGAKFLVRFPVLI